MNRASMFESFSAFVLPLILLPLAVIGTPALCASDGDGRAAASPCNGYTLYCPIPSTSTYLIDNSGTVLNTWSSSYEPGQSVYWLEDDSILRSIRLAGIGHWGGAGGGVERIAYDGTVLWHFEYSDSSVLSHHDIEPLPNGNVLIIAWDFKTYAQAVAEGRNPSHVQGNTLMSEKIIEVEPTGPTSGDIVWEWCLWDHLIQDYDPSKNNYGTVGDHPELVDLNFPGQRVDDWIHANSIDYNPDLDQIMISSLHMDEIWVIDHSTTTAEAAGHTGGNSGKGGDILYRWGNPKAYDAGTSSNQKLFGQHDAQWIAPGLLGEGNILIFNNGKGRPGGNHSSVDEIIPPVDASGHYAHTPGTAYEPSGATWSYTDPIPSNFYSDHISGAQRLPNDNTLICAGPQGYFFEVTQAKETVWEYTNPYPSMQNNFVFKVGRYRMNLWCDQDSIPASTGGTVEFSLSAGEQFAGRGYLLAGSMSGTSPGTPLPGGQVTIPLNRDWFTDYILANLNNAIFSSFLGTLDGTGRATAWLNTPPIPTWAGTTMHFAFATMNPYDFASIPLAVEIVP